MTARYKPIGEADVVLGALGRIASDVDSIAAHRERPGVLEVDKEPPGNRATDSLIDALDADSVACDAVSFQGVLIPVDRVVESFVLFRFCGLPLPYASDRRRVACQPVVVARLLIQGFGVRRP